MSTIILEPSISELEPFRSKSFNLLLYPEWDNYSDILSHLKREHSVFLGMITHDKDVSEDGTLKKDHTHVVIRFENQVWSSALCKRTGLPHRYKLIENTLNFRKSVRYLVHYDDEDKFQYSLDDVWVSDKRMFDACLSNGEVQLNDERQMFDAINVALQTEHFDSEMDFIAWCYSMGYSKVANKWKYVIHNSFQIYQGRQR